MTDDSREERRPDPDPSTLATANLLREITLLREKVSLEVSKAQGVIETRLDGMDKAIALLQTYPTEVDRKVGQLRELTEEQFKSVADLFLEKEKAVTAAFQAAKEAVGKSETAFTKQIDAVHASIGDVKDRLNRGEGRDTGIGQSWGVVITIILAGVAILGGVGTIVAWSNP